MSSYIPSSEAERREMLEALGLKDVGELYRDVPESVRLQKPLDLPEGLSEMEVRKALEDMAKLNRNYQTILRGAGAYDHYIPSIVRYIPAKEEFLTAYTPYQAEMSQGLLQSIFEYQTMICELTGMDVSNASVYDGASAAAEAAAMCRDRKRSVTLISGAMHPDTINTVRTYCYGAGTDLKIVPVKDGKTDLQALKEMLAADTAGFIFQQPNFYGNFEDAEKIAEITHTAGAKLVMGVNPISLAIIQSPAEAGADIAVGDGQPLGMPIAYGGPYVGFMATNSKMMRKLPGRIVGETTDDKGERAFVLTLQAREQHIRREKASSNICSNQDLCTLIASVYMAAMGKDGMRAVATQSMSKAHYLAEQLEGAGFRPLYRQDFFNEFITDCPCGSQKLMKALENHGILGGLPITENAILWCATEMNTKKDMDDVVTIAKAVMEGKEAHA